MTIRVLLQKLHRIAGEVGIDSPVCVHGLDMALAFVDVQTRRVEGRASAVLQVQPERRETRRWSDNEVQLLRSSKKQNMEYWEIARTLNFVFNNRRTKDSVRTKWKSLQ